MQLEKLLDDVSSSRIDPQFRHLDVQAISCDSRKVIKGTLFVALQGGQHNGTEFIKDAIRNGASVVVSSENMNLQRVANPKVCFLTADNAKEFLAGAVKRLYGNPSAAVKTIGITGTNGKTTVSYLIESILGASGRKSGVIGTVNYRIAGEITPSLNTTPDFVFNQHFLRALARKHIPYCVMEVSSHALDQRRVEFINFRTAVFTNLTSDHLDYHKSRERYFAAKAQLFTQLDPGGIAVINVDDIYGRQLCSMTDAKIITYGMTHQADVMAKDVRMTIDRNRFFIAYGGEEIEIEAKLIGKFNIYNMLAAAAACLAEGISYKVIKKGIERLEYVPGRLETVASGQDFPVFIDYAHTEDALENVLTTVREVSDARVILVFGCGGDRDKTKRPLMGKVAGRLADIAIVTSDNPRSEPPQSIIDQIVAGFQENNYKVIVNRKEAIHEALGMAGPGDLVLIAGKGHEDYQVLADKTIDFNERRIIQEFVDAHHSRN
jgi:UDP-N-acetylmuramyl-tripeptide synthetase